MNVGIFLCCVFLVTVLAGNVSQVACEDEKTKSEMCGTSSV